jgi:ABC-type lipoprotein release transport system permease subunit
MAGISGILCKMQALTVGRFMSARAFFDHHRKIAAAIIAIGVAFGLATLVYVGFILEMQHY